MAELKDTKLIDFCSCLALALKLEKKSGNKTQIDNHTAARRVKKHKMLLYQVPRLLVSFDL